MAAVDAVVFYANHAIHAADLFYGYAAAALLALVIGKEAPEPYRSVAWQAAAAGSFAFGWWRKLFDLRLQGYLLLILGLTAVAVEVESNTLAIGGALAGELRAGRLRGAQRGRPLPAARAIAPCSTPLRWRPRSAP